MSSNILKDYEKIDKVLEMYYEQFGIVNYRNKYGLGRFLQFIIDEEFDNEDLPINEEFGDDCTPNNWSYPWVGNQIDFPIPSYIITKNNKQKESFIFYFIQYCYKNNQYPSQQYIRSTIVQQAGVSIYEEKEIINPYGYNFEFDDYLHESNALLEGIDNTSSQSILSFDDWDSACNGCRLSDQSSDDEQDWENDQDCQDENLDHQDEIIIQNERQSNVLQESLLNTTTFNLNIAQGLHGKFVYQPNTFCITSRLKQIYEVMIVYILCVGSRIIATSKRIDLATECLTLPKTAGTNSDNSSGDTDVTQDNDKTRREKIKKIHVLPSRIDDALSVYYKKFGRDDYYDENGCGRFIHYIRSELIDDELIEKELGDNGDPNDCLYTEWFGEFPIPSYFKISNQDDKKAYIFYIMQYCLKYGQSPNEKEIHDIIYRVIKGYTQVDDTKRKH